MNRFRLADVSFLLGAVVGVLVLGAPWTYVDAQETSSSEITNFAPVPDTGQQDCWDENGTPILCAGSGQDGELQRGVAWPTPRFIDNRDGTVLDNLTGLLWLKNANCFGRPRTWQEALDGANNLADSQCGLKDGSKAGDWRLPNVRELQSLLDFGKIAPALPSAHPFSGVARGFYWSSTTSVGSPLDAWGVVLIEGSTFAGAKFLTWYVWPVRDGAILSDLAQE
jgi:hypothetical protein